MQNQRNYPIYQSYTLTPTTDQFSSIYILSNLEAEPNTGDSPQYEVTNSQINQHLFKDKQFSQAHLEQQTFSNNSQTQESIECESSGDQHNQSGNKMMVSSIEQMVNQYQRKLKLDEDMKKGMSMNNILCLDQYDLTMSQQFKIQGVHGGGNAGNMHKSNETTFDRGRDRVFPCNPFLKKRVDDYQAQQLTKGNKDKFWSQIYQQCQRVRQKLTEIKQYNHQLQTIYQVLTKYTGNLSHKDNILKGHIGRDDVDGRLLKEMIGRQMAKRNP